MKKLSPLLDLCVCVKTKLPRLVSVPLNQMIIIIFVVITNVGSVIAFLSLVKLIIIIVGEVESTHSIQRQAGYS